MSLLPLLTSTSLARLKALEKMRPGDIWTETHRASMESLIHEVAALEIMAQSTLLDQAAVALGKCIYSLKGEACDWDEVFRVMKEINDLTGRQ